MNEAQLKKILMKASIVFVAFVVLIYVIAYDSFRYSYSVGDTLSATMLTGELVEGEVIEQRLMVPADSINGFEIKVYNYDRGNSGILHAELIDAQNEILSTASCDISQFTKNNEFIFVPFANSVPKNDNNYLILRLYTEGCSSGNAIAIYTGNSVTTGRFDVHKNISPEDVYKINGSDGEGMLCIRLSGVSELSFYKTYWLFAVVVYSLALLYCFHAIKKFKQGRNSFFLGLVTMLVKYKFLLKQLIERDFKIKYKRSSLGMVWSFLNPLLTMSVQYIVFSTLFKSDIPNYPVYLLSGIVLFNFFSEAVSMGMTSITSNAALIKKVYMPKYIYPVSKVCSSTINFALSFIPIFLVMLVTRTEFHFSLLLLVFCIMCLFVFIVGMVLILSTMMTFFQDTQFIWSVLSMVWMYATPIFYPENIIPSQFLTLYHINPMYQYVTFARIAIIDGVSPAPTAYLWCIISSIVVFLVGVLVFKKNQDKFVLYL